MNDNVISDVGLILTEEDKQELRQQWNALDIETQQAMESFDHFVEMVVD